MEDAPEVYCPCSLLTAFAMGSRAGHVADAPSGHGISFRHAVDNHHAIPYGLEFRDAVDLPYEIDMLVDFIGKDDYVGIFRKHVGKALQLVAAIDAAGGVGGGIEHYHARLGSDGLLQLLGGDLEILLHSGVDFYRHALGEFHHLHVAHPRRNRDNHLVAGVDCGKDHVAKFLLRAVAHDDTVGSELDFVFAE